MILLVTDHDVGLGLLSLVSCTFANELEVLITR